MGAVFLVDGQGFVWSGTRLLYHNLSKELTPGEPDPYSAIASVYRYDFDTGQDELLLVSDDNQDFWLQDVLPDGSLLVLRSWYKPSPGNALEIWQPNGTKVAAIYAVDGDSDTINFIGWLP